MACPGLGDGTQGGLEDSVLSELVTGGSLGANAAVSALQGLRPAKAEAGLQWGRRKGPPWSLQ